MAVAAELHRASLSSGAAAGTLYNDIQLIHECIIAQMRGFVKPIPRCYNSKPASRTVIPIGILILKIKRTERRIDKIILCRRRE